MSGPAGGAADEAVTICTVATAAHYRLIGHNVRLVEQLNPGAAVAWSITDNGAIHRTGGGEAPAGDAGELEALAPGAAIIMGPTLDEVSARVLASFGSKGEEAREHRRLLAKYLGSYHHAAGLNLAMAQVATRYAVVMDPDFYVIRPDWIAQALAHMRAAGLAVFGAPWSPRWYQKFRGFPCSHLMVIDLHAYPWRADLFAPDLVGEGRRFGSPIWEDQVAQGGWGRLLARLPAAVAEDARQRRTIGQTRDTGWAMLKDFEQRADLKAETLTAVFEPADGFMPATVGPLQASGAVEAFLPERLRYLPRAPGAVSRRGFAAFDLPDFRGRGWEEFLWRDEPFAFHVRGELHRRRAGDTGDTGDASVREGLAAVLQRRGRDAALS